MIKKIFRYTLTGEEAEGRTGAGVVGAIIDCIYENSLEPLRDHSRLLRQRITVERLKDTYKSRMGVING